MLTYFPAPYPDEWWYSVLCRYYTSTGIREHAIVKEQLFGGNGGAHMGTVFPNGTVAKVIEQLPTGIFDSKEIILRHTPFLYYTRMYPLEERRTMLEALCRGETVQLTHLWKSFRRASWRPRYCPVCADEEKRRYGEPYWHTDHQIPLMSICTKHHCRLRQLELDAPYPALNQRFYPLAEVDIQQAVADYPAWEEQVSTAVREYWKLPFTVGPTAHNNLAQMLKDRGYLVIYQQGNVSLEPKRIYADLQRFYGVERVRESFGDTLDASMVNRIIHWKQLLPDRYILLQTMIGAPTALVFGEEPLPDALKEQLQSMAEEGGFHTIKQAAERLNMKQYELNTLIRYYGMKPFWMPPGKVKYPTARTAVLRCTLEREELDQIEQVGKKLGYRCAGAFALDCVRYVVGI